MKTAFLLAALPMVSGSFLDTLWGSPAADIESNVCNLKWNYCPRDPGCITYTMSVHDVRVQDTQAPTSIDAEDLKPGAPLTVEVTGETTLTTVPTSGSYRIYGLEGGNVASGVLTDVLTIETDGTFTMEISFDTAVSNFDPTHTGFFEFGIDVFQSAGGSDEAMCIEVASVEYESWEKLKPAPPFVFYCTDGGDGHFTPSVPAPPAGAPITPNPIVAPSCHPTTPCDLDWFYCPRDPGCKTYTMSVSDVIVNVRDKTTIKAGDQVTLTVNGTTSLTSCPDQGSYRIYSLEGKNQGSGTLCDVLTVETGGLFVLSIPITLTGDDFTPAPDNWLEFGLDVFQENSGSDEAMCIQISNPAYANAMAAKSSPAFATECKDNGGGHFEPCSPECPEIVEKAICLLG